MSDVATVLYLESDDEVTSVVRRIRQADAPRVIVVAPGRSRATSSAVALRLIARAAETEGREVVVVGDALTRSLAAEAKLPAYANLEDARGAAEVAAPVASMHAPIRVVRGGEDTVVRPAVSPEDATVPVAVAASRPVTSRRPPRSRTAIGVVVGLVAVLLVAFVAGATVLPGATVTIVPTTVGVGPFPYTIEVADPERLSGTVEATATVTATDTYERLEAATGIVVFRNWTPFDQVVPAETLVAAGDQAFETQADVLVPSGDLTPEGRIAAGEAQVGVVAAAPGPAANVEALAIDTVLDAGTDARLRGFRDNDQRTVLNPEPTSGGIEETGPRISQADVEAAVASLTDDLRGQAGDALVAAGEGDRIVVQPDLPEPSVDGVDGLVGTRDETEATISGTLAWEAFATDADAVRDSATSRVVDDPSAVPEGHALLEDSIQVDVQEANVEGEGLRVDVTVTGLAAVEIDPAEVVGRIMGRTEPEAAAALADLGRATVDLWPGWVTSVPQADWRIDVRIAAP